ncbi:class I SAM-dependent methyltransferase [Nocardia sp. NPDC004340]
MNSSQAGAAGLTAPEHLDKDSYREFYDQISRSLDSSPFGKNSSFLNYGYLSLGTEDEARELPAGRAFNVHSIRLACELVGSLDLTGRAVLDVGCGRGGVASLLADHFGAAVTGVDISPAAIEFCRGAHPALRFEVGDAEHLPVPDSSFEVVTNVESSHTYPSLAGFLHEVRRVLRTDGRLLHTDLLEPRRWQEFRAGLEASGITIVAERDITANVVAARDKLGRGLSRVFGPENELMANFLAIPGSAIYEQLKSGGLEYRIIRATVR